MNQIIITKFKKYYKKNLFMVILIISFISLVFFFILNIIKQFNSKNEEKNSNQIISNYKLFRCISSESNQKAFKDSDIVGYIKIPKINVSYPFYYGYSQELLKSLPCRFYGNMPPQAGNLCITAHNYNDNRFFGKISELNNDDIINIENYARKQYIYFVYDKYEVSNTDLSPLEESGSDMYILTLITCNNYNNKRIIIKAKRKT